MYQTTTSVWIPCFKFNSSSNLHLKNKNSWLIRSFIVPPTSIYFFSFCVVCWLLERLSHNRALTIRKRIYVWMVV
jgi:hypothetical protein